MGETSTNPFVYQNTDNAVEAFHCLAEFRAFGELCDIVLCVGNLEIPAHRVVLAATSPYFKAMFTGELAETNQDRVVLYEIDSFAIESLVRYAYTGVVKITEQNVQSLLYASGLLQINKVKKACSDYLRKELDVCNCLGIRSLAETLACDELFEVAHQFAVDHFGDVLQQEEFLLQPYESLKSFLENEFLNISGEEEILNGVLSWLNFHPSERQVYAYSIIKRSQLMKATPDFLSERLLKDSVVRSSVDCQQLIVDAIEAMKSPSLRGACEFPAFSARLYGTGREVMLAIGGESAGLTLSGCESFNPVESRWSRDIPGRVDGTMPLPHMNKGRTFMAVASTGHHTYVAGGSSSWKILDSVERYEWPVNQWCSLSPLCADRMGAGAAILDGQLVVLGGYSKTASYLSSAESYDPLIDKWTLIAPMRAKRSYLGAVAAGGSVYAIGGYGGVAGSSDDWLRLVENLDPERGTWLPVAPLSQPRAYFSAVEKDGSIYALGGYNSLWLNSAERFDPREGRWYSIQPMRTSRSSAGASSMGNCLYVAGGFNGVRNLNSVESYDTRAGKWLKASPMQSTRYGMGLVTMEI